MKRDVRNIVLKRREVVIELAADKNPGFAQAIKILAEQCKASKDCIAIQSVKSSFGSNLFLLDAHIYDSVSEKTRYEPRPIVKKEKKA